MTHINAQCIAIYDELYEKYLKQYWKKEFPGCVNYYDRISVLLGFRDYVKREIEGISKKEFGKWMEYPYHKVVEMIEDTLEGHSKVNGKQTDHWKVFCGENK